MEAGTFYAQLKRTLETEAGDVWTETVLEGERRGEKHLLTSGPEREGENRACSESASDAPPSWLSAGLDMCPCPLSVWERCWDLQ